jgi:MtrB/PioB family decaheme-associated outer membrane protein
MTSKRIFPGTPALPGIGGLCRARSLQGLALLGALVIAGVAGAQAPPPPDTSGWTCSQCPFFEGLAAQAELGAVAVKGANASYGRYTGEDRSGGFVDAGAQGQGRNKDGDYVSFDARRLGLPARDASVTEGHEGRYELTIGYDGQPNRLYQGAVTPLTGSSGGLHLPQGWVPAGTTGGMSALGASLVPADIGSERRTVSLQARYFAGTQWTVFGALSHQEKDGTAATSASFLTQAVQLVQPFDTVTDTLEAGVAWAGRSAGARLGYTGSWFDNSDTALRFDNPYLPLVPGSIQGQLGTAPSNTLQQLSANGNVQLPWRETTLSASASIGSLRQNAAFVPVSTLPGSGVPPAGSLNGDVRLSHYALGGGYSPLSRLSLRGNARFDGRDDRTAPLTVNTVVTDTFAAGPAVTPRYGQNRMHLDGGADYALQPWARLGVGGTFQDVHYAPGQVLDHTHEVESWGRVTITPIDELSLGLKLGNGLRKVSGFNATALPPAENPLIRAFNTAPRDRSFATLSGAWTATPALALTLESTLANDDYRSSPLGLQSVHERSTAAALTWTPSDTLSGTLDAAYQSQRSLQNGYSGSASPGWLLADAQRYWNLGAAARWTRDRWAVALDYRYAPSTVDSDSSYGAPNAAFPQNTTRLESAQLGVSYTGSPALQWHLRLAHEGYRSSDWALGGVGPSTVPNLLALGIMPLHDSVNLLGVTVRYRIGAAGAAR